MPKESRCRNIKNASGNDTDDSFKSPVPCNSAKKRESSPKGFYKLKKPIVPSQSLIEEKDNNEDALCLSYSKSQTCVRSGSSQSGDESKNERILPRCSRRGTNSSERKLNKFLKSSMAKSGRKQKREQQTLIGKAIAGRNDSFIGKNLFDKPSKKKKSGSVKLTKSHKTCNKVLKSCLRDRVEKRRKLRRSLKVHKKKYSKKLFDKPTEITGSIKEELCERNHPKECLFPGISREYRKIGYGHPKDHNKQIRSSRGVSRARSHCFDQQNKSIKSEKPEKDVGSETDVSMGSIAEEPLKRIFNHSGYSNDKNQNQNVIMVGSGKHYCEQDIQLTFNVDNEKINVNCTLIVKSKRKSPKVEIEKIL